MKITEIYDLSGFESCNTLDIDATWFWPAELRKDVDSAFPIGTGEKTVYDYLFEPTRRCWFDHI